MKVIDYIKGRGLPVLDSQTYRDWIELWWKWYQGYVPAAHDYYVRTTTSRKKKFKRYTLGMAKTISEDYASLLLNEKVQITSEKFKNMQDILDDNHFQERGNRLVEIAMALGTGAFVEFKDADDRIRIDYLRADMIFPIRWDGDTIYECAFASILNNGIDEIKQPLFYVQIHRKDENGQYVVENVFLNKDTGMQVTNPDSIAEISEPSPVPLFQIIRPNAYNAIDPYSPMGMSVYGLAQSQLEGCDIVYDSFINEFVLGKKRIMVPQTMGQIALASTGKIEPFFDPNDGIIHVYKVPDGSPDKMQEYDFHLRMEEHNLGLQRALDILSKKCGLGTRRYQFEGGGVKTATEVISENSDLYQSVKRNTHPLERAIVNMVKALSFLDNGNADVDVTVEFDDSIIEDETATTQRCAIRLANGTMSKKQAIMEMDKISEKEAEARLAEIQAEEKVTDTNVMNFTAGEQV